MKKYVLGIAIIVLVIISLSYLLLENDSADEKMIADFSTHYFDLERIVEMAKEDASIKIVREGIVVPSNAISFQRQEEYLKIFHDISIKNGLEIDENGDLFIASFSSGLTSGGVTKGYAFRPSKIEFIYDNLDSVPSDLPSYTKGFKKIATDWYLFIVWED